MIAPVLFGNGAEVLICGHIKPGAANAIMISGGSCCAPAHRANADDAVGAYIAGELKHDQSAVDIDEICGHDGGEGHEHL